MKKSRIVLGMAKEKMNDCKRSVKRTFTSKSTSNNSTKNKTEFAKAYLGYCDKNKKPFNSNELIQILRELD